MTYRAGPAMLDAVVVGSGPNGLAAAIAMTGSPEALWQLVSS